jgi:tRNA (uracil-5-)-methyltransferase
VIKTLRTCKGLDHLIYVACNPTAVIDNLNDLCLPNKKGMSGPAFDPIFSYVVDLFP